MDYAQKAKSSISKKDETVTDYTSVFVSEDKETIEKYKDLMNTFKIPNDAKTYITNSLVTLVLEIAKQGHKLIIIRGLPGSGKSVCAKQLQMVLKICFQLESVICEADFFMGKDFDINRLNACHLRCQNVARLCLKDGKIVIVSNTSTTKKEVDIYREILKEEGFENKIRIIEPLTPWKYDVDKCLVLCEKNIPKNTMVKYLDNIKNNK